MRTLKKSGPGSRLSSILFVVQQTAWLFLLFAPLCPTGRSQSAQTAAVRQRLDPSPSGPPPDAQAFILVGAGDIAGCKDLRGARATAKLIEQIPGTVFAA